MTNRAGSFGFRIRVAGGVLALLLASYVGASAQEPLGQGLGGRLDPETAATVQGLIDSIASHGVPGEPLVAKALEGQSKGATGERIVVAVRSLGVDLAAARTALGGSATSAELVAGAGAIRAGASADVLSRIKAIHGTRSTLLPLATLTDLIARGIPVDRAVGTVLALAERGASEADYRAQGGAAGSRPEGAGPPAGAGSPPPAVSRPVPVISTPGAPPPAEPFNPRPR